MKLNTLSFRLVTTEKRRIVVQDVDADLEEDEEIYAEYEIKLKEPKVIPVFDLITEDGDKPLLVGAIYLFRSGIQVVAITTQLARCVQTESYKVNEFKLDISGEPIVLAQTWKEE
jgi:hypothetical protein